VRHFRSTTFVPVPPEAVFDVISDVPAYPGFVSGCTAASAEPAGNDTVLATLTLSQAGFRQTIRTRNIEQRPDSVRMELVDGPMQSLDGTWTCAPEDGGCRLGLDIRFAFEKRGQELLLGRAFESACARLLEAAAEQARRRVG